MVTMQHMSRSPSLRGLIIYEDRPLGSPKAPRPRGKNARSSFGRAGDFQPTPVTSAGVNGRRDHHTGGQWSLPERTGRHGARRCAGEPARFRRSLRRRQRKFDHTAKRRDHRGVYSDRKKNYFYRKTNKFGVRNHRAGSSTWQPGKSENVKVSFYGVYVVSTPLIAWAHEASMLETPPRGVKSSSRLRS